MEDLGDRFWLSLNLEESVSIQRVQADGSFDLLARLNIFLNRAESCNSCSSSTASLGFSASSTRVSE